MWIHVLGENHHKNVGDIISRFGIKYKVIEVKDGHSMNVEKLEDQEEQENGHAKEEE